LPLAVPLTPVSSEIPSLARGPPWPVPPFQRKGWRFKHLPLSPSWMIPYKYLPYSVAAMERERGGEVCLASGDVWIRLWIRKGINGERDPDRAVSVGLSSRCGFNRVANKVWWCGEESWPAGYASEGGGGRVWKIKVSNLVTILFVSFCLCAISWTLCIRISVMSVSLLFLEFR
jgi:hypothetical protein